MDLKKVQHSIYDTRIGIAILIALNLLVCFLLTCCSPFGTLSRDPVRAYPELSQATYKVHYERGVKIPMRDGITLAADIAFPDGPDPFPTVLIRTPYGRRSYLSLYAHFAQRGYAVMAQSCRGREENEGEFIPWLNERQDGYDTLDWIHKQPWSNGKVGMIGVSYNAQVQWTAAAGAHPALATIIPMMPGTDHFFDVPYSYGILSLGLLNWAHTMEDRTPPSSTPEYGLEELRTLPLRDLDEATVGRDMKIWNRWVEADRLGDWSDGNFLKDTVDIDIPILHISGWWDGESSATKLNYEAMKRHGKENQWLIYGPWPHALKFYKIRNVYDQDFGPNAVMELTSLWVRWFDTWLKDKDVGLQDVPKVQVFVTGINEWRGYRSWPPLDAQTLSLYLDSSDKLQGLQSFGHLVPTPAPSVEADTYPYDPALVKAHPFQSTTTMSGSELREVGEGLFYQTDPLEEGIVLAGPAHVELYFSTTGRDTDFYAALVDIDLDDHTRLITNPGWMRMRYLSGWDNPSLLEPGSVNRAQIEMKPFAHYFAKGHRIGLHLRSDWFPALDRNLNTGERIKDATRMVAVQQSIYRGSLYPSAIHIQALLFRRRDR